MRKNAVTAGQEYLQNLAESRRIARTGEDVVLDYLKFYARVEVHEAVAAAHMALAQFLDDIAASSAARADDIPVLTVWNLNAIGSTAEDENRAWQDLANSFQALLQNRPQSSMGLILHKKRLRTCLAGNSTAKSPRSWRAGALTLRFDISLNYNRSHGNNRESLTDHGWICFSRSGVTEKAGQSLTASSPWASSAI